MTFGTPYIGVQNTEILSPLCKNKQTDDMEALNDRLDELKNEWTLRFNQDTETAGKLTPQVPLYTFSGRRDRFVTRMSACGYAKICEVVDGDHYSIVKPITREHLAYRKLQRISSDPPHKAVSGPLQSESEIIIQGVMPVHLSKQVVGPDNIRFVDRRLGFIVKALNPSTTPKTVEVFILDGCVPIDPWFPREAFIDRDLLPKQLTFNEDLAVLAKTAIQKIRTTGAVRADSRVLPSGSVGYVGILLPLPPGMSGAMMVVKDSASLKRPCSEIPRPTP
ncbi:MAG: hypothetical protein ABIQ24_12995, partial [Nitrospiraceae bacterium]